MMLKTTYLNYLLNLISWFSKSLFILILFLTSILGVSLNSMLMTWVFMEINLLSFIPLISLSKNFNSHMTGLKYFLVQTLGSIFLLISILLILFLNKTIFFNFFFLLSLLWKMGAPPFHFWLFSLMMELSWFMLFILASWQKILPLFLINKIYFNKWELIITISILVCVVGSILQSSIKKLLIFSSIFTGAWILASMVFFKMIWLLLLFIYSTMLFFFIMCMLMNKMFEKESEMYFNMGQVEKLFNFFILLSIAGIPPFMGFFMKISVLFILMLYNKFFLSMFLVISSIFMVYMYVSIFLNSLSGLNSMSHLTSNYKNFSLSFLTIIFFSGPFMFLFFY